MLPLSTSRLVLRRFTLADVETFMAYRNDPDVARYQSWEGCTRAEAERLIHDQQSQEPGEPGQWYQIAIALKEGGALLGDCALRIHTPDVRQATIGFTLARANQRHGYATEALTCLLAHLFQQKRLHRVVADTDPQNVASWTLLERLGMRREGHLRQSLRFKGQWADEYLYAVLAEDWLVKREGEAVHEERTSDATGFNHTE
ncbi:GNAT family protein [soil metagenome]